MKYAAAGLIASLVFFFVYFLPIVLSEPVLNLMGWHDLGLPGDMTWWRVGVGLVMGASVFRLYVDWRNEAALKWRKALASRARA